MKQLIIAEKPSVAKDLSRVLKANQKHKTYYEGSQVVITWALGHLLSLKMPEDLNKDWQKWQMETLPMIPKKMGIKPLPKTTHQLKAIAQLAKRKDIKEAVIATDAGREGELVARWILQWIQFDKPVKRLWISSQTDRAIKEGFLHLKPSSQYDSLYYSALARAQADWLIGLNVTRALTVKYQDNLSAGRVQTPTLALVRKQEQAIECFVAKHYYQVNFVTQQASFQFVTKQVQALDSLEKAQDFIEQLTKHTAVVSKVEETIKQQAAPFPYDLTELQREANHLFGYSAKKTLSLVQSLYETHKIVTYPRTDSKYLTTDMQQTMFERLQALRDFAPEVKNYLKSGGKVVQTKVFNNAKVSDHHALIPTEQQPNYAKLSSDEARIYQLIAKRFLMLFAPNYKEKVQTIHLQIADSEFRYQNKQILEVGFKHFNEEIKTTSQPLTLAQGQKLKGRFELVKQLTTPPRPLNEGSLLAKMEKHSLGTPATRAEIIEKLVHSDLMERKGNTLVVTPKGRQLLSLVTPSLVSPELTEKWERELEKIAQAKAKMQPFIQQIEKDTRRLVEEIKQSEQKYQDFALTQKRCPECGSLLKEKNGRDGKRLVCTGENCHYSRRKEPKLSNHRCPQCHKKMEIIEGQNGAYYRCKYDGTTEKMPTKTERKQKMTKHEEKRLLKKYSQENSEMESPLALALKAMMDSQE
ncbi:DNA topoisomerase 3 [Enterococcus columbae]|uniref:DNA topoisomerase n=1 Tax=Enterococcus columbae DSM 7374 = ATCC 51263 TaxID=1121865 RepID=S0KG44_9ENTE|nr:DNA topoisomerase 3 [Enterococcus columbae]EOT39890.1 DNA topoisomerase III [Enterococcus columbae DSM 7374 = ATCC 51263]EOW83875.1 DNA topoisomerase III [Enterococcus columbae DSM 7374 = ATCC 51263]